MTFYIQWSLYDQYIVDAEDIKNKLDELIKHGAHLAKTKTSLNEWTSAEYVYRTDEKGKWTYLYFKEGNDFDTRLCVYKCNKFKRKSEYDERDAKDIHSSDCKAEIVKLLKKHTGTTLCKAFKPVSSEDYKNIVPKPVYYVNRGLLLKNIGNVQYSDVSSMYPANARGRLPDAHTAQKFDGRVEPNEEYPFAFYLKSNHCAEYGVFDTHEYMSLPTKYYMWQCYTDGKPIYNDVKDEDEVTVLMKASKYEMTKVFEEIYQRKLDGDPIAKAVANIGIGTLHRNPSTYHYKVMHDYYHVAAIILGRSNRMQYDMIEKIENNGGTLLQAIVDSLIYIGEENYGIDTKVLGEYYNEFHQTVNYRAANINKYVIYNDEGNILKYVVSGVDKEMQNIKTPEDIDMYRESDRRSR